MSEVKRYKGRGEHSVLELETLIENFKEENIELKAQLEMAEKVLDFYSDCGNWGHISYDKADYVVILNDSGVGDFQINDITDDDRVGGRRAREYFKEKEQV